MNLRDLLVLYALVGVACAVAVLRKERAHGRGYAIWSAAASVALWPLWAPFVLATPRPRERPIAQESGTRSSPSATPASAAQRSRSQVSLVRIERALEESVKAVAGTPMSQVFSRQVAQRIAAEVTLVADRIEELSALASCEGLDREASAARLRALEARAIQGAGGDRASERTLATARLQYESLTRLEALRAADSQAIDELADLLEALRAQLLLARYAGSTADGTGAIVSEVWARLEGLGAAFEPSPGAA